MVLSTTKGQKRWNIELFMKDTDQILHVYLNNNFQETALCCSIVFTSLTWKVGVICSLRCCYLELWIGGYK